MRARTVAAAAAVQQQQKLPLLLVLLAQLAAAGVTCVRLCLMAATSSPTSQGTTRCSVGVHEHGPGLMSSVSCRLQQSQNPVLFSCGLLGGFAVWKQYVCACGVRLAHYACKEDTSILQPMRAATHLTGLAMLQRPCFLASCCCLLWYAGVFDMGGTQVL